MDTPKWYHDELEKIRTDHLERLRELAELRLQEIQAYQERLVDLDRRKAEDHLTSIEKDLLVNFAKVLEAQADE